MLSGHYIHAVTITLLMLAIHSEHSWAVPNSKSVVAITFSVLVITRSVHTSMEVCQARLCRNVNWTIQHGTALCMYKSGFRFNIINILDIYIS